MNIDFKGNEVKPDFIVEYIPISTQYVIQYDSFSLDSIAVEQQVAKELNAAYLTGIGIGLIGGILLGMTIQKYFIKGKKNGKKEEREQRRVTGSIRG